VDKLLTNSPVYQGPAIEADASRVRQMFDANVFGLFDLTQALVPLLLAAVPGSSAPPTIINTSSIVSIVPFGFAAQYNASKAAIASYSDTLRIELAPLGIKVVTLFMGEVSTVLMSPDHVSFGPDSLYTEVEAVVQERSRSHTAEAMKPAEFARQVASGILSTPALGKSEYLWKGSSAFLVWFLHTVGFKKIFDPTVEGAVGLNKSAARKAIFEKGQRSVEQK
jgi:1-acylglycerone phosphate reductase